jgi:hypothetical protein
MRGALKRRRRTEQAPAPKPRAAEAGGATTAAPPACGLLTCPHCGLRLETLAFRCPRCLGDIPLGCSGNCRACGKAGR